MSIIPQCETPNAVVKCSQCDAQTIAAMPVCKFCASHDGLFGATLPDGGISDSERRVRTQAARVRAGAYPPRSQGGPTGRDSFHWLVALATTEKTKWPPYPALPTATLSTAPRTGVRPSALAQAIIGSSLLQTTHRINNDRSVAVSTDVFWNEDMSACPRGVKVQLLGRGGVAVYGLYDGGGHGKDPFFTGWAPVPRRRPA